MYTSSVQGRRRGAFEASQPYTFSRSNAQIQQNQQLCRCAASQFACLLTAGGTIAGFRRQRRPKTHPATSTQQQRLPSWPLNGCHVLTHAGLERHRAEWQPGHDSATNRLEQSAYPGHTEASSSAVTATPDQSCISCAASWSCLLWPAGDGCALTYFMVSGNALQNRTQILQAENGVGLNTGID